MTPLAPTSLTGGHRVLPARAPGVELLGSLAGSGYRRAPGLVRRGDGQTVQLTPLLYALLEAVDGQAETDALAVRLGVTVDRQVSADDVEDLLAKLRPLGLLGDADGLAPAAPKANPLLALTCKVVVTDPAVTRRITAPFARLFAPYVVWPVLALFAVTVWWTLLEVGLSAATSQAAYQPGLLLTVFALTVVSAGFHEFGHAAACRYGGATPGAMGAGLYLLWPAFYTDVDDSYRLSRWGRLRVDLGGLYFNAIVAVVFGGLALVTGVEALLLLVATQLLQMVRQLAPFIRADGYHLLADLTGVPDLFAHIGPTLSGLLPHHWGRPSPLQRWARVVVTTWVLVMVPVLVGLLVFLVLWLPRLAATAWDAMGVQAGLLAQDVAAGDPVMIAVRVLSLVSIALPVAAITYLLVRIVRRTAARVLAATAARPQARVLALLAVAFLAAVVAGAWWPAGQYGPVQAGDAGGPRTVAAAPTTTVDPAPVAIEQEVEPAPTKVRTARTTVEKAPVSSASAPVAPARSAPGPAPAPTAAGPRTRPWPFPFAPPAGPRAHDNQALAVGLTDGAVVRDVSTSWERVTDGRPVDSRNEAWALTSCEDCTTVAIAFQVVLVVGQSDLYAPVNSAVGLNYQCVRCQTHAVAVQLVATLNAVPDGATQARLRAAWSQVQGLEGRARGMTLQEVYALIKGVEAQFLTELQAAGVLTGVQGDVVTSAGGEPAAGVALDVPGEGDGSVTALSATTTLGPQPDPVPELEPAAVPAPALDATGEPVPGTTADATGTGSTDAEDDPTAAAAADPTLEPTADPASEPAADPTSDPTDDGSDTSGAADDSLPAPEPAPEPPPGDPEDAVVRDDLDARPEDADDEATPTG